MWCGVCCGACLAAGSDGKLFSVHVDLSKNSNTSFIGSVLAYLRRLLHKYLQIRIRVDRSQPFFNFVDQEKKAKKYKLSQILTDLAKSVRI